MRKLGLACCYVCFALITIIFWKDITNSALDSAAKSWEIGCDIAVLCGMALLTRMMTRVTR